MTERDMENKLKEVLRRRDAIIEKREKQMTALLARMSGVLSLVLIVLIYRLSGTIAVTPGEQQMGSFLLRPGMGGYILVAVIAFALGVLVTLLARRKAERAGKDKEKKDTNRS